MPTNEQNRMIEAYYGRGYPHDIAAEFDRLNAKIARLEEVQAILVRIIEHPPDGPARDWITSPAPREIS